jgi:hypothetical protein
MQSEARIARRNVTVIKLKELLKNYVYILKLDLHKQFMNLITRTQLASNKCIYTYLLTEIFAATHNEHLNAHQAASKLSFTA